MCSYRGALSDPKRTVTKYITLRNVLYIQLYASRTQWHHWIVLRCIEEDRWERQTLTK